MKKHSMRFTINKSFIDPIKQYTYNEAIALLKKLRTTKFIESMEAHICLQVDPKVIAQQIRTQIILPHGNGKEKKIAIFGDFENLNELFSLGVYKIGNEELLEEISKGIITFDILITLPTYVSKLAKFGKILGPKGLMPSQKTGTVTTNIIETILEFKTGKLDFRTDKTGIVHLIFGKINFVSIKLEENLKYIYNFILKNRPNGIKGRFIKSFFICNTMSPSIEINIQSFKNNFMENNENFNK